MKSFRMVNFKLLGTRCSNLDNARGRLVLISAVFVFAYIVVIVRAVDLSVIQGRAGGYGDVAVSSSSSSSSSYGGSDGREHIAGSGEEKKEAVRSDILDRNGVLLAGSLKTKSLYADPFLISNPEEVADDLSRLFPDISRAELLKKLSSKGRFVWIKRHLAPDEQADVLNLGYPGLAFREEYKRIYPQGNLVSHMVGYTGIDGKGLAGVELSFDKLLEKGGKPLFLTLDTRLQHVLRRELAKAISKHKAKAGAGVIMNVNNGEVLAAVSLPDFDSNMVEKASDAERFNRVSLGVYELGSTFKILSTAAFIEKKNPPMGKTFDARQPLICGKYKIHDYHAQKRVLTLPEVFIHSSNIGAAMMGEALGEDELKAFYSDLGLMNRPDFEINEVGAPLFPKKWRDINVLTAAYGHGVSVSPLQMASAASSVINGGFVVTPTLLLNGEGGEDAEDVETKIRLISERTSHRIRQLMKLNVSDGTGKKADVPGYMVGGKTGTANKPGKGGYSSRRLISSFYAAFPIDAPEYAIYVMIDEPKGIKETHGFATGGWVAAPVVKNVVKSMVSILGIVPRYDDEEEGKGNIAGFADALKQYIKSDEEIAAEKRKNEKREVGKIASNKIGG